MKGEMEINARNLKKGDKIKFKGETYEVRNFLTTYSAKDNTKEESREIILTKSEKGEKALLKQRYVLRYDDKTGNYEVFKESHEKLKFHGGFQEKKEEYWSSYEGESENA